MHNYGHKVEATMDLITNEWIKEDKLNYWENFAAISRYDQTYETKISPNRAYCGNAHFAHNSLSHYDFDNTSYGISSCADWKNFPNFTGATENLDCTKWGCVDEKAGYPTWGEFWLGSIPRSDGEVLMTSKGGKKFYMSRNWWQYLLFPENTIKLRQEMINGIATPTATAKPRPTATAKPTAIATPKPTATAKPTAIAISRSRVTATPKPTATPSNIVWDKKKCDLDNTGVVTLKDYSLFRKLYKVKDLKVDFDGNGLIDSRDKDIFESRCISLHKKV